MASIIVLGYDGSGCADAALATAVETAKADWAEEALAAIRAQGVADAEAAVVDARPAEALVQVAVERDARMIAVGTHGERPLTGAVLGSVPHRLLHLSTVPVLVVPAGS